MTDSQLDRQIAMSLVGTDITKNWVWKRGQYAMTQEDIKITPVEIFARKGDIIFIEKVFVNDLAAQISSTNEENNISIYNECSTFVKLETLIPIPSLKQMLDLIEAKGYRGNVDFGEEPAHCEIVHGFEVFDTPYFSCRGYVSQSEMWNAALRLSKYIRKGQSPIVIHLGDHDPSGIDMSRDIKERLEMFAFQGIEVNRIALNMEQIEKYNPPPNPAKMDDTRYIGYVDIYGENSWELDALDPEVLEQLISDTISKLLIKERWENSKKLENIEKEYIKSMTK